MVETKMHVKIGVSFLKINQSDLFHETSFHQ